MALDPFTSKKDKKKVSSKALHPEFHYPLVTVAEVSVEKDYVPFNWLDKDNKVTMTYLIDAAQRHLDKVKLGIDINDEEIRPDGNPCSNQPYHAAQVAYNMLMLVMQIEHGVAIDDRSYPKQGITKRINQLINEKSQTFDGAGERTLEFRQGPLTQMPQHSIDQFRDWCHGYDRTRKDIDKLHGQLQYPNLSLYTSEEVARHSNWWEKIKAESKKKGEEK